VANRKITIARGEIDDKTNFVVKKVEKAKIIFQNDDILVVDKPAFINSDELERQYKGAQLLHRLDRETSGVLMLVKNEEFRQKAIAEFKKNTIYKEYTAWVEGMIIEEIEIDKAILTEKRNNKAHSKISKQGKPAKTMITPLEVVGKRSKIKLVIEHGRTHQIRCHLRSIDHSIVGDEMYGGRRYQRVMLHANKVRLLGMVFESPEPKAFKHLGMS
jgi:23S rRNA pseudouridine1911/1915/1917 synthase